MKDRTVVRVSGKWMCAVCGDDPTCCKCVIAGLNAKAEAEANHNRRIREFQEQVRRQEGGQGSGQKA